MSYLINNTIIFLLLLFCGDLMASDKTDLPINMAIKLYYGDNYELPNEKTKVLIQELTFTNASKTETLTLSLWGSQLYIKSIHPRENYRAINRQGPDGRLSAPTKNSVLKLGPGQSRTIKAWFWPYATLPWFNEKKTEYYKVSKEGPLAFEFCYKFSDDSNVFKNHLNMKVPHFSTGQICLTYTNLDFRILMSDENEE